MIFASAQQVDSDFFDQIGNALRLIEVRRLSPIQRLATLNAARFRRTTRSGAQSFVFEYFRLENAEPTLANEGLDATHYLELEAMSTLAGFIKLTNRDHGATSAYGCSARRVGADAYIIDTFSPVFGGNCHWLFK